MNKGTQPGPFLVLSTFPEGVCMYAGTLSRWSFFALYTRVHVVPQPPDLKLILESKLNTDASLSITTGYGGGGTCFSIA